MEDKLNFLRIYVFETYIFEYVFGIYVFWWLPTIRKLLLPNVIWWLAVWPISPSQPKSPFFSGLLSYFSTFIFVVYEIFSKLLSLLIFSKLLSSQLIIWLLLACFFIRVHIYWSLLIILMSKNVFDLSKYFKMLVASISINYKILVSIFIKSDIILILF